MFANQLLSSSLVFQFGHAFRDSFYTNISFMVFYLIGQVGCHQLQLTVLHNCSRNEVAWINQTLQQYPQNCICSQSNSAPQTCHKCSCLMCVWGRLFLSCVWPVAVVLHYLGRIEWLHFTVRGNGCIQLGWRLRRVGRILQRHLDADWWLNQSCVHACVRVMKSLLLAEGVGEAREAMPFWFRGVLCGIMLTNTALLIMFDQMIYRIIVPQKLQLFRYGLAQDWWHCGETLVFMHSVNPA